MPVAEDDSLLPFALPSLGGKKVTAAFDGGMISSDGGVLLLAGLDRKIGLIETLAALMPDRRNPLRITHSMEDILRAPSWPLPVAIPMLTISTTCAGTPPSRWPVAACLKPLTIRRPSQRSHAGRMRLTRAPWSA